MKGFLISEHCEMGERLSILIPEIEMTYSIENSILKIEQRTEYCGKILHEVDVPDDLGVLLSQYFLTRDTVRAWTQNLVSLLKVQPLSSMM